MSTRAYHRMVSAAEQIQQTAAHLASLTRQFNLAALGLRNSLSPSLRARFHGDAFRIDGDLEQLLNEARGICAHSAEPVDLAARVRMRLAPVLRALESLETTTPPEAA